MKPMGFSLKTTTVADLANNVIIIKEEDSLMESVSKQYIFLQDQAVRACLIKMGWTPPEKEASVDLLDKRRLSACLAFCKDISTTTLEAAVQTKILEKLDEIRTSQGEGFRDIIDAYFKDKKAKSESK